MGPRRCACGTKLLRPCLRLDASSYAQRCILLCTKMRLEAPKTALGSRSCRSNPLAGQALRLSVCQHCHSNRNGVHHMYPLAGQAMSLRVRAGTELKSVLLPVRRSAGQLKLPLTKQVMMGHWGSSFQQAKQLLKLFRAGESSSLPRCQVKLPNQAASVKLGCVSTRVGV
jgi:hypothetical protein